MAEDRWNVEKQERSNKMAMDQQAMQQKQAEQQTLQEMLSQDAQLLEQVTISDEAMQ